MRDIEIIYPKEKINPYSSNPNGEFSTSRYLFCLNLLEGHQKIREHSFPKVNPQKEDYSKLVNLLKESGLKF